LVFEAQDFDSDTLRK